MALVLQSLSKAIRPRDVPSMADWLRENFYTPNGRAFDEYSVPWVTAPQGPCWAYDNPQFNAYWLQWAARMFKTNFGLATLMRRMDVDPADLMFATPDETNCKQVFSRWWKMIGNCPRIRGEAPIERYQAKTHIRLKRSQCYGAWPRGKSRLADKSIPAGHANEIDKWEQQTTSTEGDPLPRFLKRGAEYPDRKFVMESTPGTKGKSRVEAGRLQSTNHSYHVPCPHCGTFQEIVFARVHWDKLPNGNSDRELARRTAHYVCVKCEAAIDDTHRADMINRGVWVPFGCEVDHDRAADARDYPPDDASWLRGEPAHNGNQYGSKISVFYAVFHGWGQIADDFLAKKDRPQDLRQWTNEDAADTWEIIARKQTWEQLGSRVITDIPRGEVPAEHTVVTVGIDKQESFYVYSVVSWGSENACHTVDYGIADGAGDVQDVIRTKWKRQGDGKMLAPSAVLIDSGYRPADVHRVVGEATAKGQPVRACRGSYGSRLPGYYANRQNGPKSSAPGQWVTWIDTHSTQDWLDQKLQTAADEPGGMSLHAGSIADHQDYLEQLLNDGLVSSLNTQNNVREEWQRIDTMIPNDLRDCLRYAFVGMLLATRGGSRMPTRTGPKRSRRHKTPPPAFLDRPGGWLAGVERQ